ncbi:MAG: META domain-containing protein [candidate division Zixibacteria bacterium]|nr:META domain-containing protein [candidate division Zixibacteria bacterium]
MTGQHAGKLRFAVLLLAIFGGCVKEQAKPVSVRSNDLVGAEFRFVGFSSDGNFTAAGLIDTADRVTLSFGADSAVAGSAGCNRFAGKILTLGDSELSFGPMISTKMMCEPAVMRVETEFLRMLGTTASYSLSADTLILRSADRSELLFVRCKTASQTTALGRVTGYLKLTGENMMFRDSRTQREYHLSNSNGVIAELTKQMGVSPNDSVFAEIDLSAESQNDSLPHHLIVARQDILRLLPAEMNPLSTRLTDLTFLARGNEPFWSARISGNTIVVLEPEKDSLVINATSRVETDSLWVWESANDFRVRISRVGCFDPMSGAYSAFTAEITVDGRTLTGCALAGTKFVALPLGKITIDTATTY